MEKQKVKKSVLIRQKKAALREFREENAGNLGQVKAHYRDIPTSPRKMRLIADMIRGKSASLALGALKFEAKIGATYLTSLLKSAIANWQQANSKVDIDSVDLYVKDIFVDGGRMLKRLRPAPQGRGYRVRKRSNHVTIVLDTRDAQ
ncbi:MAG: 50S ribosomal protein L22 [Cytophagales bacterium]|nr:MAG: 50S ribosomal protein L22 [Cytophagales bacterium]TAH30207.1 MAG: 50S ribosomal protein L22 [Cytophagales bacterium]